MRKYLLVEVRIGDEGEIPTDSDWASYIRIRGSLRLMQGKNFGGGAEIEQVLELTDNGIISNKVQAEPMPDAPYAKE
jgi:hypothetical protein